MRAILAFVLAVWLLPGCGNDGPERKPTYKVKGRVLVNGQPAKRLGVKCQPVAGLDATNPTITSAFTDENGVFELSTYEKGDGIPEGEYVLTFRWGEINPIGGGYDGDKLGGLYNDAKKNAEDPKFKIKVEGGQDEVDLGTFELEVPEDVMRKASKKKVPSFFGGKKK